MGVDRHLIANRDIKKGEIICSIGRAYRYEDPITDEDEVKLRLRIFVLSSIVMNDDGEDWERMCAEYEDLIEHFIAEERKRGACELLAQMDVGVLDE